MLATTSSEPVQASPESAAPEEYRSCIQCVDQNTGKTGCFVSLAASAGNHRAISPVFADYMQLGHWMGENGWASAAYVGPKYIPLRVVKVD